jgi:hypothetical protein
MTIEDSSPLIQYSSDWTIGNSEDTKASKFVFSTAII